MKFKYQAKTKEGELQVGFVDAGSRDAATSVLAGHGLFVLSLEAAEKITWYDTLASYFGRVKSKDMIAFTRQLATLLEARLPLSDSLKTLYEQTDNPTLKESAFQISEDIDSGLAFSQALERQGATFPRFYIEMVKAAEVTGNLNEIAGFLADYVEKEGILASKVKSALVYPALVIGLFAIVSFIVVAFVFPQIGPIFEQSGVELPFYTKFLLGSGIFLGKWWPAILLVIVVLGVAALDYARTPEGQALVDDGKVRMPLLSKIYVPLIISRFSNSSSLLIHGGIPIAQAIEIVGHMVDNVLYRDVIHEVSEDLRRGELLSQSIAKHSEYFPPLVWQMIAVGEKTGKIEQVFDRLTGFYGREADNTVNNIVDLIQPVLMIGIGALVALLFASILIPIYSLTASIG